MVSGYYRAGRAASVRPEMLHRQETRHKPCLREVNCLFREAQVSTADKEEGGGKVIASSGLPAGVHHGLGLSPRL